MFGCGPKVYIGESSDVRFGGEDNSSIHLSFHLFTVCTLCSLHVDQPDSVAQRPVENQLEQSRDDDVQTNMVASSLQPWTEHSSPSPRRWERKELLFIVLWLRDPVNRPVAEINTTHSFSL